MCLMTFRQMAANVWRKGYSAGHLCAQIFSLYPSSPSRCPGRLKSMACIHQASSSLVSCVASGRYQPRTVVGRVGWLAERERLGYLSPQLPPCWLGGCCAYQGPWLPSGTPYYIPSGPTVVPRLPSVARVFHHPALVFLTPGHNFNKQPFH